MYIQLTGCEWHWTNISSIDKYVFDFQKVLDQGDVVKKNIVLGFAGCLQCTLNSERDEGEK